MIVKRVGPLSFAKVMGALYVIVGLVFGALVSLLSVVGGAMAPSDESGGMPGMLFGAAAIVILPIFYGVLGFLTSLVGAVLYNVVASAIGGIELDLQ
jgi:hypothetical protein